MQLLSGVSLQGVRNEGTGRVTGAECTDAQGKSLLLHCGAIVDCAGPYARAVGVAMGGAAASLPLINEVRAKAYCLVLTEYYIPGACGAQDRCVCYLVITPTRCMPRRC